ncbi:MAG: hypothetical protein DMF03_06330 [Verrucomicrobia bacterium]|nr:MAG: hypothetical protein DMF03_06330 [Verrucomicrobiota bacterium]
MSFRAQFEESLAIFYRVRLPLQTPWPQSIRTDNDLARLTEKQGCNCLLSRFDTFAIAEARDGSQDWKQAKNWPYWSSAKDHPKRNTTGPLIFGEQLA